MHFGKAYGFACSLLQQPSGAKAQSANTPASSMKRCTRAEVLARHEAVNHFHAETLQEHEGAAERVLMDCTAGFTRFSAGHIQYMENLTGELKSCLICYRFPRCGVGNIYYHFVPNGLDKVREPIFITI